MMLPSMLKQRRYKRVGQQNVLVSMLNLSERANKKTEPLHDGKNLSEESRVEATTLLSRSGCVPFGVGTLFLRMQRIDTSRGVDQHLFLLCPPSPFGEKNN